jgi:hypothetical protein
LANESEIRMHNNNIDSDLFLHIEDYDKNSEWVIQKYNPLFENNIFKMIDMNFIMFINWRIYFFINNVIIIAMLLFKMNYNKNIIWQIKS